MSADGKLVCYQGVNLCLFWLQYPHTYFQAKDSTLRRLAYGGSLGRLNQHHGRGHVGHYHSSLNSNLALRTAV